MWCSDNMTSARSPVAYELTLRDEGKQFRAIGVISFWIPIHRSRIIKNLLWNIILSRIIALQPRVTLQRIVWFSMHLKVATPSGLQRINH